MDGNILKTEPVSKPITSRKSIDFPARVFLKHNLKMTDDCCGFKFLRGSVEGEHSMRFQRKNAVSNFSRVVWTGTRKSWRISFTRQTFTSEWKQFFDCLKQKDCYDYATGFSAAKRSVVSCWVNDECESKTNFDNKKVLWSAQWLCACAGKFSEHFSPVLCKTNKQKNKVTKFLVLWRARNHNGKISIYLITSSHSQTYSLASRKKHRLHLARKIIG